MKEKAVRRRVVVLELNELCPPLLARFMAAGDLPNFTRLHDQSIVYVTDAEEPQGHLNPWIQWVTAHTGVGYDEHGVFKLGEGAQLGMPTVADSVSSAGERVWLCGPMNVVPTSEVRGRWLADPWNPDPHAGARDMEPFAAFVRANVQEHTNPNHRLGARAYVRFVRYMARHGMSARTVRAVVGQLVGERTGRSARWRRAALLDRFQWDLFRYVYERERPLFATYFSNTTAHYQHLYWRYMAPDDFELKPTPDEIATFGDAVRSGYMEMDRIVGEALDLAGDEGRVVLCTAISQQPYTLKDDAGGSRFYRPNDIESFVQALGIEGVERVAPVMSAQYHVLLTDEDRAVRAEQILRSATVGADHAFDVRRVGCDVFAGFALVRDLPSDATIDVSATGVRLQVHSTMYRSETAKSGYHHPEGALWIHTPDQQGVTVDAPVPLRAVAPTLLSLMGIEAPPTMRVPALPTDPSVAVRA